MKKLGPTKTGKVTSRLQRVQRRNYQVGGTKKRSVHPGSGNPPNPQNPVPAPRGKTKRKRRPYKLHEATIKRLVASIDGHCDAPMYVHLRAAGIHPDTFNEWKGLAAENPDGLHAFFLERVDKALARAWGRLHEAAVKHRASEVLFRRHHEDYPSERQRLELTGAEGLPLIPTENAFNVVLELHQPPGQAQEPEPAFRIVQPDGKVDLWTPPQRNGQEPPS